MRLKWWLLLTVMVASCSGEDELLTADLTMSGPHVVAEHLVWVNRSAGSVVWLDPAVRDQSPTVRHLGRSVDSVAVAGNDLLMLDGDRRDPALLVLSIPGGDVTPIAIETPFERALIAPSGNYAVLLHDARLAVESNVIAQNNNEVAVVDVAGRTVTRIALDTASTSPRDVVFADTRAAIVLDAAVVVVDLEDPARRVKIPLVLGTRRLVPEEVLFGPDQNRLFLRTNGTPDVLVTTLRDGPTLSASVNFLSAPGAVRLLDIDVAQDDPDHVVAVFSTTSSVGATAARLHVDGDISRTSFVRLSGSARRVEAFDAQTVLVHGSADLVGRVGSSYVAAWDFDRERLEEKRLAGASMGPPVLSNETAFFLHAVEGGVASAVTALSVERSVVSLGVRLRPLVIGGRVTSYVSSGPDAVVLAVEIAREDSGAAPSLARFPAEPLTMTGALVVIESEALRISNVVLDDPVESVGVVGNYFYAVHPSVLGDVTIVPRDRLKREDAWRFDGVFTSGLFDRAEVTR